MFVVALCCYFHGTSVVVGVFVSTFSIVVDLLFVYTPCYYLFIVLRQVHVEVADDLSFSVYCWSFFFLQHLTVVLTITGGLKNSCMKNFTLVIEM